jgi:excisionase family DNA binding protein
MKPLMKREEVAEYLKVSTKTVRRFEERGQLPRIDLSRTSIRYRPEDVEKLLEELTRKRVSLKLH